MEFILMDISRKKFEKFFRKKESDNRSNTQISFKEEQGERR